MGILSRLFRRKPKKEEKSGGEERPRGIFIGKIVDVFGKCTFVKRSYSGPELMSFSLFESGSQGIRESYAVIESLGWYSMKGVESHELEHAIGKKYLWELERQHNPHIVISGASGTGKSSFLKSFIWDLHHVYNLPLLIIDFHGEYREITWAMGGKVVDLSKYSINPFSYIDKEYPESPRERLYDFIESLKVKYPELGPVQFGILVDTIKKCFEEKGIREDDESTWLLSAPTFREVFEKISELADYRKRGVPQRTLESAISLKLRLEPLVDAFGLVNTINLDELISYDVVCLDLSKVPSEDAKDVIVEWLLRKLLKWKMRRGIREEKLRYIVIDEAHRVAKAVIDRESGAIVAESIISNILRESRKYNLAVLLATQRYTDLSDAVRTNASTKMIMKIDSDENVQQIYPILFGSRMATDYKLNALDQFEAVFIDSVLAPRHIVLHVRVTPYFMREDIMREIQKVREVMKVAEEETRKHGTIELIKEKPEKKPEERRVGERKEEAEEEKKEDATERAEIEKKIAELPENLRYVIIAMRRYHLYTIRLICRRAAELAGRKDPYAKSTMSEYLKKLIELGLVEKKAIYSLVKKIPLIYFVPKDQRESALHRIMVTQVHMYLKHIGVPTTVFNTKGKPDIEAIINNKRTAVEIETGKKHDFSKTIKMIEDRFNQGYEQVIVITPDVDIKRKYEEKLSELKEKYGDKLRIIEYIKVPYHVKP